MMVDGWRADNGVGKRDRFKTERKKKVISQEGDSFIIPKTQELVFPPIAAPHTEEFRTESLLPVAAVKVQNQSFLLWPQATVPDPL